MRHNGIARLATTAAYRNALDGHDFFLFFFFWLALALTQNDSFSLEWIRCGGKTCFCPNVLLMFLFSCSQFTLLRLFFRWWWLLGYAIHIYVSTFFIHLTFLLCEFSDRPHAVGCHICFFFSSLPNSPILYCFVCYSVFSASNKLSDFIRIFYERLLGFCNDN